MEGGYWCARSDEVNSPLTVMDDIISTVTPIVANRIGQTNLWSRMHHFEYSLYNSSPANEI